MGTGTGKRGLAGCADWKQGLQEGLALQAWLAGSHRTGWQHCDLVCLITAAVVL